MFGVVGACVGDVFEGVGGIHSESFCYLCVGVGVGVDVDVGRYVHMYIRMG